MKATLFALFVGLLMVGCGESSQPSESVDTTDTAPKKDAIHLPWVYFLSFPLFHLRPQPNFG